MPLTDYLLLTDLFILAIFITGSLWRGIAGEIEYRKGCQHFYLNDMYDYQMSMTCTKCGNQAVLSTEKVDSRTNHTRSN